MHKDCPWCHLTLADEWLARGILGQPEDCGHEKLREPDLVIAPDGNPYLYRWHLTPRNSQANVYFHIQIADDPERPLHDHPWDNFSVVLSGGYDEIWNPSPERENVNDEFVRKFRKGDTVSRRANEAHRLLLPPGVEYSMTLFSTGPKVRDWGFWYPGGWKDYRDVTRMIDGMSVHGEGSNAQSGKH